MYDCSEPKNLAHGQELQGPDPKPAESLSVDMARLRFHIPQFAQRTRIDHFLTRQLRYATRNRIQKAIAEGRVTVNGRPVKNAYALKYGDQVEIILKRPAATDMVAQAMPLDILYEDEAILVLNKPPGIAVHPTYQHWDGTLANALLWHYRQQVGDMSAPFKPGLIHRLDKNTSGVLVVGKTLQAKQHLSRQFEHRQIHKIYVALVWGVPRHQRGILETNLGISRRHRMLVEVYPLHSNQGKPAKTGWEVLEKVGGFSLLRVVLFTGRTHQIRCHLRHLGHPIVGDALYGGISGEGYHYPNQAQWLPQLLERIPRQALHAEHLEFIHPVTGQPCVFRAPLPADMQAALNWLRNEYPLNSWQDSGPCVDSKLQ